ncbi:MAG: aldo/keto reductase [Rhodospirillaceae bacterium]|nr:aldo/keto reductase [Rhodospirillaceae bacterium]MBT5944754.1 aldo/keto reductase [Rhodospirillaceae bacterium]MBT6405225.1 aldo/keto reductase [Rhodospirillaceae bacterium]MBT6536739.1 aldo/keto reductase [Rhodospirillaceae bacterium]MBT7360368.1 aldo/keto reductase [Rhodospirillaceae bacterium]
MKKVPLGSSGLTVSQLGLGANRLLDPNEAEWVATVNEALDRGLNFIDSAAIYGMGRSESFFGAMLGERRREVVLASKCGIHVNDAGKVAIDGSPTTIKRECDESLQRLNTDVIDLYYLHQVPKDTPLEDSIGAMADLVTAGKVQHLAICNATADQLRRAHATHPMMALQTEYSLFTREPEADLIPVCRELGIAFVAYGPLAYAFFGGGMRSRADVPQGDNWRLSNQRFQDDAFEHNLALLDELTALANEIDATPGQLSLAWLLAKGDDIIPIPGSRQLKHLRDNLGADAIRLTPDQVARIDAAFPPGIAQGGARGGHSPQVANF